MKKYLLLIYHLLLPLVIAYFLFSTYRFHKAESYFKQYGTMIDNNYHKAMNEALELGYRRGARDWMQHCNMEHAPAEGTCGQ